MISKITANYDGVVSDLTVNNSDSIPPLSVLPGFTSVDPTPPAIVHPVLQAGGAAFLEKDLGSPQTEVWLTFDLAFNSTALAYWVAHPYDVFAALWFASESGIEWIVNTGPIWEYFGAGPPFSATVSDPAPIAATWQTLEYHYRRSDGVFELYINGSLADSHVPDDGPADFYNMRYIVIGQVYGDGNPDEAGAYYKHIKCGSTRRGTEFFSEDFTGDLSAWVVAGACAIVEDPYPSVLKSDASAADAYLEKDLGAGAGGVWVEFQLGYPAETLTDWLADISFTPNWIMHGLDTTNHCSFPGTGWMNGYYDPDNGNAWTWQTNASACGSDDTAVGSIAAATWVTVELHIKGANSTVDLYINSTLVASSTVSIADTSTTRKLRLGQEGNTPGATNIVYYKNLKIGTSQHGSDLFTDDFSGDLLNWDTTSGNCTVINDPFP